MADPHRLNWDRAIERLREFTATYDGTAFVYAPAPAAPSTFHRVCASALRKQSVDTLELVFDGNPLADPPAVMEQLFEFAALPEEDGAVDLLSNIRAKGNVEVRDLTVTVFARGTIARSTKRLRDALRARYGAKRRLAFVTLIDGDGFDQARWFYGTLWHHLEGRGIAGVAIATDHDALRHVIRPGLQIDLPLRYDTDDVRNVMRDFVAVLATLPNPPAEIERAVIARTALDIADHRPEALYTMLPSILGRFQ